MENRFWLTTNSDCNTPAFYILWNGSERKKNIPHRAKSHNQTTSSFDLTRIDSYSVPEARTRGFQYLDVASGVVIATDAQNCRDVVLYITQTHKRRIFLFLTQKRRGTVKTKQKNYSTPIYFLAVDRESSRYQVASMIGKTKNNCGVDKQH